MSRFLLALVLLSLPAAMVSSQRADSRLQRADNRLQRAGGRLQTRFQQMDSNGDGQLAKDEFTFSAKTFAAMDVDGSDNISLAEASNFIRSGGKVEAAIPDAKPTEFVGEFSGEIPLTLASCRKAAEYSAGANGHAVLVMYNGRIVYEKYDNGWSQPQPHRLASGTKSFAGVTAAIAVQNGLFDFDDRVSDTITEWKDDPTRSRITIRQLLSLTSGLDPGDNSVVLPYAEAILSQSLHRPGKKFAYGPNPFQVFGELMRRKLADKGQSSLDYLREQVLEPIGMKTATWRMTKEGDPHIPSGAFVTAREWVKFGELLRLGGVWNSKSIIRRELLHELIQPSEANRRYGITFWLGKTGSVADGDVEASQTNAAATSVGTPGDLFMAAGAGKQRLYIVPSLKLVVVRFGETQGRRFQDEPFFRRLLPPVAGQ